MVVPIEHKTGGVGVGAHVLEQEPIADFGAAKLCCVLVTDLVQTITGWPKDSGWHRVLAIIFFVSGNREPHWHWVEVVIDHIVERAIHAIVNVEGL